MFRFGHAIHAMEPTRATAAPHVSQMLIRDQRSDFLLVFDQKIFMGSVRQNRTVYRAQFVKSSLLFRFWRFGEQKQANADLWYTPTFVSKMRSAAKKMS